jgi:isoquinoline 1-oxidoreductase alpha subunit
VGPHTGPNYGTRETALRPSFRAWYQLSLVGTKFGCGVGLCGACTVHVNGQAVKSCSMPISAVGSQPITTIEALSENPIGQRLQAAWIDVDVAQCGYCQAGQLMAATALLSKVPQPTDAEIDTHMSGNLCRCATYTRIRRAIKQAAGETTTKEG